MHVDLAKPWVYRDIPEEVYFQHKALSNSDMGHLAKSPAHFKHYQDHREDSDSDSKAFGRAVHCAILEPERFKKDFIVSPFDSFRTTEAKEWKAQQLRDGNQILTAAEIDEISLMKAAVYANHDAAEILSLLTDRELVLIWNDDETGLVLKAKLDGYSSKIKAVIDIKTTKDASKFSFEKAIIDYRYHNQGAHYLDGANALGLTAFDFIIIAIESNPPYCTAVYRLREDAINIGRERNGKLKRLYNNCLKMNSWPGYPPGIAEVSLPEWALKQAEKSEYGQEIKF